MCSALRNNDVILLGQSAVMTFTSGGSVRASQTSASPVRNNQRRMSFGSGTGAYTDDDERYRRRRLPPVRGDGDEQPPPPLTSGGTRPRR